MSGAWIKMRVSIVRDTRVIAIADYLAQCRPFMDWLTDPVRQHCNETAYEHVTRYVMVSVTVSALLAVWGLANEIGEVEEDDLVLPCASLGTLDEISGVPCFGEALGHVGWAIEEITPDAPASLRLPKFMKNNVPSDERGRSSNAVRQQRYRERKAEKTRNADDVTRNGVDNVTVTPREEKRREEDIHAPRPRTSKPKKTRLAPDFGVSEQVQAWARDRGFNRLPEHLDAFKRKATAKGYEYVDWDAAFMEAVREDWAKLRAATKPGSSAVPERRTQ